MDLSVLSAENYDDRNYAAEARATDRPYPTRYYGGIVISDEDEHNTNTVFGMVNPASQEVRPWKKSGKNSRGSEENSNGRTQRGRPRFDPRDATAADVKCSSCWP